jgi:ribosomal protein S18 acetylase RimI-like enzyme
MPDILKKIPFAGSLLPAVQDFDCGDAPWEASLAAWIKADQTVAEGALYQMGQPQLQLQVWLHVNTAGDLVGYSSLGLSRWQWPALTDKRVPISVIPNVAIARKF